MQSNGTGVNIYVVSGGVHKWHQDFTTEDGQSRVVPAHSVHHASPADIDIRGEGTAAAGAAAGLLSGVAKGATVHSVKVFRDETPDFTAPTQDVLDGLSWIHVRQLLPMLSCSCTFSPTAPTYLQLGRVHSARHDHEVTSCRRIISSLQWCCG